jgi:hypothetical protein
MFTTDGHWIYVPDNLRQSTPHFSKICFKSYRPDTHISRETEDYSFGDHLGRQSVRVMPSSVIRASVVLCSVSL